MYAIYCQTLHTTLQQTFNQLALLATHQQHLSNTCLDTTLQQTFNQLALVSRSQPCSLQPS